MRRHTTRSALVLGALLGLATSVPLGAEEVKLRAGDLTLNGALELPDGKSVKDGVVVITHGLLAHNGMEIIQALQGLLKERGVGTLAINLSLGVDDRHGMYDCATAHRHRQADAASELAAWMQWLKGQGAKRLVLLGHSRGGNQTALVAAEHDDPALAGVVLAAPALITPQGLTESYKESTGKDLAPLVAKSRQLVEKGQGGELQEIDILYCNGARATPESFLSYHAFDPRFDTPALLDRIRVPVLVVVAGADEVVSGLEEAFAASAAAGKAQVLVIDGADHFFRDLYAEDLADRVTAFAAPKLGK